MTCQYLRTTPVLQNSTPRLALDKCCSKILICHYFARFVATYFAAIPCPLIFFSPFRMHTIHISQFFFPQGLHSLKIIKNNCMKCCEITFKSLLTKVSVVSLVFPLTPFPSPVSSIYTISKRKRKRKRKEDKWSKIPHQSISE